MVLGVSGPLHCIILGFHVCGVRLAAVACVYIFFVDFAVNKLTQIIRLLSMAVTSFFCDWILIIFTTESSLMRHKF